MELHPLDHHENLTTLLLEIGWLLEVYDGTEEAEEDLMFLHELAWEELIILGGMGIN
jgi:hypothetical protein